MGGFWGLGAEMPIPRIVLKSIPPQAWHGEEYWVAMGSLREQKLEYPALHNKDPGFHQGLPSRP